VNFKDLNKASLKDIFPLTAIEVVIDNTSSYFHSWMDHLSKSIKMAHEDGEDIAF